ncbi:hypothetical protein PIB30_020454 [Stylosanthes scabra]|uniref:Uncharacterized protein n=1 Tax=Stylosanthes scabra TaxID=79078 RepID=A0ABU6UAF7_9FABA|nr:hypothetical protein [Stylosanthes scabra]
MSGRDRGFSQSSSRSHGRGRGRSAPSSEPAATASPSTSTPSVSQVAPTIPPAPTPSTQPPPTGSPQVAPSPHESQPNSSHTSQSDPPTQQVERIPITWDSQKGFELDNNVCTQAISDMIELMLNEPWINYSEIPAEVQKWWYEM